MQVPFVKDEYRGEVPINWYPAADSSKGVVMFSCPGLLPFATLPDITEVRALGPTNQRVLSTDYMYAVGRRGNDSFVFKIDNLGTVTEIGSFSSTHTGPCWILNNGALSYPIMIVDGSTGYVYDPGTNTFAQITDVNFPGAACAAYQDGYGIVVKPSSRQWSLSNLLDFTTWDPLMYATKEGQPDQLVAVISDHREVWLFGTTTTEVWYNTGTGAFPFSRIDGGFLEKGLGAPASLVRLQDSIVWLSDEKEVLRTQAYKPIAISSQKMIREISGYPQVSDAIAYGYTGKRGHEFYVITFPSAQPNGVTWVFDATTSLWHKRSSYVENSVTPGRHRGNCYAYFANKHLVGDYANGKIYQLDKDTYTDNDIYPIIRFLESNEYSMEGDRMFFPDLQFDFDQGVGLPDGTDPQVALSWSDDHGNTWVGGEPWSQVASAGLLGEYNRRTIFRQLGSAFYRIFRLTVKSPCKWYLLSVNWMNSMDKLAAQRGAK